MKDLNFEVLTGFSWISVGVVFHSLSRAGVKFQGEREIQGHNQGGIQMGEDWGYTNSS